MISLVVGREDEDYRKDIIGRSGYLIFMVGDIWYGVRDLVCMWKT